ncbi:MAG: toll/interleukin-1 receptor domain-containing protein [Oscillospiraceae bacterium]|nr:toll/interleukin-1 receptor domain-containing protein [Oscillospiraceae bacterium]
MSELKFKTRSNSNPQKKSKVYFSCHLDDFKPYFESVSDEILKIIDCTICYYDPLNQPDFDENYYLNLGEMQLFVIPITNKFLTKENRAFNVEFKYAIEHHIPVLPLMQEIGLEELFNKKCGDLQFLDKNSHDITAISYEEKLEKYLKSVLIGDEMAARIRSAFDAYIFLSYRKKDRKYAKELMRMIHKNDFCRDIAIWYDEFLTPGENFNSEIVNELKKSVLFTLVVTPNLLTENNYVMREEYPLAMEEKKPILPAELVTTDKTELNNKFEGIPDPTNAHDVGALSEALMNGLQGLAIRENDGDPVHNFHIGLAYLGGIDVEVDRERALELITSAAQAGLTEALQKIRNMYLYGDGVTCNMSTAASWTKKLSECLGDQYQKEPTEVNGILWVKSLWDLGDYLNELGKPEKAFDVYNQMRLLCEDVICKYNNSEIRRSLAVCYAKLGLAIKTIDREKALMFFQNAVEQSLKLYDEEKNFRSAWDLAIANLRLGNIISDKYPTEALKRYAQVEELLQEAASMSDSNRERRRIEQNIAVLYNSIGHLYYIDRKFNLAKQYIHKAINITQSLNSNQYEDKTIASARNLGNSHYLMGDIFLDEKQYGAATTHYLESYYIYLDLYDQVHLCQDAEYLDLLRGQLKKIYDHLSAVLEQEYMKTGNWERSEACCQIIIELIIALWGQETMPGIKALIDAYNRLGLIRVQEKQFDDALKASSTALHHSYRLYQMEKTEKVANCITSIYTNMGNICVQKQCYGEAERHYCNGIKNAANVYEDFKTVSAGLALADSYYELGRLYRNINRPDLAFTPYNEGIKFCNRLFFEKNDPSIMTRLIMAYKAMGNMCLEKKDSEGARKYYMYLLDASSLLLKLFPDNPVYADSVATAHYDLASVSNENERKENLEDALYLWRQLSTQFPNDPNYAKNVKRVKSLLEQSN